MVDVPLKRQNLRARARRAPLRRYSADERKLILDHFEERCASGLIRDAAAEGLGASLSSIKRWREGRSPLIRKIASKFAQKRSIEAAIVRLSDENNKDELSFLEALLKFIAWLRWPNKPHDHPAAMMVCLVTYIHQTNNVETLSQLDDKQKDLLLRHVRLDTLKRVCSDDVYSLPSFIEIKLDGQRHIDIDWLAIVVWFLLKYDSPSKNTRDVASLGKAYFATQNNVFYQDRWQVVFRTFKSYWSTYGAAAPFYYVERHHVAPEFVIDPSSKDFGEQIKDLISRPGDIRQFLAQVRWVIESLSERLDRRTLNAISFPAFPASLRPEAVAAPPLPPLTTKIMTKYRSV